MKALLFFDDWMVERRDCLERVWGKPTFVKELFTNYYPGFLGYGGYVSAFWDEALGKYVMYLAVYPPEADPGVFVLRLQSDDPYDWADPVYDVSVTPAWKGFKDVVVDEHGERFWPNAVFPLAGTPLAERGYVTTEWQPTYVKLALGEPVYTHVSNMGFSDDGLRFTMNRDQPWADPGADNSGYVVWNEQAGLYEIFTRRVSADRRIALSTSPDLKQFSPSITVLQPDAQDRLGTEFYEMPVRPYEDMFLGLLKLQKVDWFEERRMKTTGRIETELAYSYNGLHWYRPVREPFLELRDYGKLGSAQLSGMEILRTPEDKLLFYAHSSQGEHAFHRDIRAAGMDITGVFGPLLYEMRLDGFCSLKTWGREGVLRTKTIIPNSGEMSFNVRTTGHTAIRVQMLDGETAEPIAGYTWEEAVPISGDHLFATPRWGERADISELVDRPVRIEVSMREAELFAIRLDCQAYYATLPLDTLW